MHEKSGKFIGGPMDIGTDLFYSGLFSHLTQNTPLEVTPEQAAKIISVIERIHADNPMPVLF